MNVGVTSTLRRFFGRAMYAYLLTPIEAWVQGCSSLGDVGCGDNSPLQYLQFSGTTMGIDAYEPSIRASMARSIHDRYVCHDFSATALPANLADAVVALEVLEHLPKEEGPGFLASLERAAGQVVIISTPNGFVPQDAIGGNAYQRHLSGWEPEELRKLGYCVHGILGLRELRGPYARITRRPRALWAIVSRLTQQYVWRRPERAFGLLCHKQVGGNGHG